MNRKDKLRILELLDALCILTCTDDDIDVEDLYFAVVDSRKKFKEKFKIKAFNGMEFVP